VRVEAAGVSGFFLDARAARVVFDEMVALLHFGYFPVMSVISNNPGALLMNS